MVLENITTRVKNSRSRLSCKLRKVQDKTVNEYKHGIYFYVK